MDFYGDFRIGGPFSVVGGFNHDLGFVPQGIGADLVATLDGFSRKDVDEFALRLQKRDSMSLRLERRLETPRRRLRGLFGARVVVTRS